MIYLVINIELIFLLWECND